MLNEERVILMTRMASYEKGEGKENVKVGNYFRSDYIAVQMLKGVVCGSLVFGILIGFYILCHFEEFMQNLYKMEDLIAFIQNVIFYFAGMVAGYGVLVYLASSWRYARAKKSLKCYYHNLKKLNSLYNDMQ